MTRPPEARAKIKPPFARFWSKAKKSVHGCWEWQGALQENGYGVFNTGRGKTESAHRYAYRLTFGHIPDGMVIMHSCDNRRCVRPDHLKLGTYKENNHDAIDKGRMRYSPRRGEGHPNSKLTEEQVRLMRSWWAKRKQCTGVTLESLARYFGVGRGTVMKVVHHEAWQHVKAEHRIPGGKRSAQLAAEKRKKLGGEP